MTREEAMEIIDKMPLCNECDSSNFPYTCVECGEAFIVAMKALKDPEIVRCKDCKHKGDSYECIFDRDLEEHGSHRTDADDDWFCADGERAENAR
jgi:predicted RNA-binding Zn-ribbon protein involved in translation (DUF1610 family)